jgi:hypothetical protein
VQNYEQAALRSNDASGEVGKDNWNAQIYCDNLTNSQADLYTSANQSVKAVTVSRPCTAGLKFSYKLGGN